MKERRRVLLIEDSPTQAERFRMLLHDRGLDVSHATSGEAALDQLESTRPDVIVVDYHLPGMNGDEFCREIRLNVNTRAIPVLMLTVERSDAAQMRGLESGADDYLAKSADPEILLARVRALLRKSEGAAAIVDAEKFLSRARLLVLDSSPTYLHYISGELAAERYIVEKATKWGEALDRLRTASYDCVLVDPEMPGTVANDACGRISEIRRVSGAATALVILTALEERECMTAGLEAGADDFISKSAGMAVTKARIRALLRRKFFVEENRRILEELKEKELEAVRARAEKEAAEVRATMADKLAEANRELERANRKLQAITEHAAEALFMTDAEGRASFVNPAAEKIFGFRPDELIGQSLHDALHHHDTQGQPLEKDDCPFLSIMVSGATVTDYNAVFFRKTGEAVEVACSISPISIAGRVTGAVLVMRDVTERNRAEERMRQAQKLESLGLLAGGVAHDFNNLLVGVVGNASLAQDLIPPGSPAGELLEDIVRTGQQAANLTRQMLAYSGKGQFLLELLNLSQLIPEMTALVEPAVPKKAELRFELDPALPPVKADRGQVQQIFMNLALNAAEAIGSAEGVITVRTGVQEVDPRYVKQHVEAAELKPGTYVFLEVRDTGCGMDEATKSRVFDPFFSTKFLGRGLGLAAVAGIVRGHSGAILVNSAPGRGSTFTVLLPTWNTAGDPAPERTAASVSRQAAPVRGSGTILIVDDEELVRNMASKALGKHGFQALTAESGAAAIELFRRYAGQVAAVILDLSMPGMSGEETLPELRKIRPDVRVVISSGYSEAEAMMAFKDHTVSAFIQKPYTSAELAEKLQSVIG